MAADPGPPEEGEELTVPDDLSSIEGLADKHRRVLARHHVTDLRGLVQADRRVIHRAMANLRPRPSLELVSRWQDEARSMLDEAVTDTSDWHTAASFVVVFTQRQRDGAWERRVEVERTEVEPERNPQLWPGWDCAPVCTWMTSQLTQPSDPETQPPAGEEVPPPAAAVPRVPATEPVAGPQPALVRPRLRIDSATLIDAAGGTDVVKGGEPAMDPRTTLVTPVRVLLTVTGARRGTRLQAVARIQGRNGPGRNASDLVVLPDSGQAEVDLSGIPAGDHDLSLVAWAPDASANPVSFRLPRITIRAH
jgi:hypothetical protein